ncbi:MAG: hypothetical protein ACLFR8_13345 [Alkalispirochaeta sp.]
MIIRLIPVIAAYSGDCGVGEDELPRQAIVDRRIPVELGYHLSVDLNPGKHDPAGG